MAFSPKTTRQRRKVKKNAKYVVSSTMSLIIVVVEYFV